MSSNPLNEFLASQKTVIIDGGLATELERRGADLSGGLWSGKILLENPSLVQNVHEAYLEAGADVIISSSYQISAFGVDKFLLPSMKSTEVLERFPELKKESNAKETAKGVAAILLQRSVDVAVKARDKFWLDYSKNIPNDTMKRVRPIVAASVGPYGAVLADGSEYKGNYGISDGELYDFHRTRLETLVNSGADLLAIETIPSLNEAKIILEILSKHYRETSAWISFTCRNESEVCEGQLITECVQMAVKYDQVIGFGINCTDPVLVLPLISSIKNAIDLSSSHKPDIICYPNTGEGWDAETGNWRGNGGE